jgi:hypothetical protein
MSKKSSTKVHTHIGHVRSLCGLAPKNGDYKIVSNSEFYAASDDEQCGACLARLQARGYKTNYLSQQFRMLAAKAEQLQHIA